MNLRKEIQLLGAALAYMRGQPQWATHIAWTNFFGVCTAIWYAYCFDGWLRLAMVAAAGVWAALAARHWLAAQRRGPGGSIVVKGRHLREVNAFLESCGMRPPLEPGTHYISVALIAQPAGYLVVDVKHKQVS